jgi:dCTP diphosphatase
LSTDKLERLVADVREFVRERDWERFHDPKNLAMAIASEAGELLAELRWVHSDDADRSVHDPARRQRLQAEVADVAIALIALCNRLGLDLFEAVQAKLATNRINYPVEMNRGRSERPRE